MSASPRPRGRYAPTPSGLLHLGNARTALVAWWSIRRSGGTFLWRLEDLDPPRAMPGAAEAALRDLAWLGLDWDEGPDRGGAFGPYVQSLRSEHYERALRRLDAAGRLFPCRRSRKDLRQLAAAPHTGDEPALAPYPLEWRPPPPPSGWLDGFLDGRSHDAAIRFRVDAGPVPFDDQMLGPCEQRVDREVGDFVLRRRDGLWAYQLAVVVDDHDMGITHVIRGDDHLNNAARQTQVYQAMGWPVPVWAHIPLIHGEDGKKLSKRHGALGIEDWATQGYPPRAMRNYLARLGWSHGDDEFFTDEQAQAWFDLNGIGKSPARLDPKKLAHISGRHIAATDDAALVAQIANYLAVGDRPDLTARQRDALLDAMSLVKTGAKTLPDLIEKARFILSERPLERDEKAEAALDPVSVGILNELTPQLRNVSWTREALEGIVSAAAKAHGTKLGKLAGPLRAALAGRTVAPSVFDMMVLLGRDETVARIEDATGGADAPPQ